MTALDWLIAFICWPIGVFIRWRRRRRQEHVEFCSALALMLISPLYMRYGTDEQVEDLYDMWHDRPRWPGWETDPHRRPWWDRYRKRMGPLDD